MDKDNSDQSAANHYHDNDDKWREVANGYQYASELGMLWEWEEYAAELTAACNGETKPESASPDPAYKMLPPERFNINSGGLHIIDGVIVRIPNDSESSD
jgi:hypothetical protein